ncbi:MAG: hypothetical protein MJZ98_00625 [Paludibacteraceae bacterium]|nr:hypothetical protein [Paludibacteraceae bacterium]
MSKNKKVLTQEQKEEELERLKQLDEIYPEVKVFVNLFYEIQSIAGFILPNAEKGLKKFNRQFQFEDKRKYTRIVDLLDQIRIINESMTKSFWDELPSKEHDMMRREANDVTRLLMLIIDRCGYDKLKFAQIESWISNMPSQGFISDDTIEQFRLR